MTGAAVIVVAAIVITAIALSDDVASGNATPGPVASPEPTPDLLLVRAVYTSNVRREALDGAPVVAIVPGGELAELRGRSQDALWLYIAYPAGSAIVGWLPAINAEPAHGEIASAPIRETAALAPVSVVGPGARSPDAPEILPDLTITGVSVQGGGRLVVNIRNIGDGAFDAPSLSLLVTSAEGELIGLFEIENAVIEPGRFASIATELRITETGTYILELDRFDEVRESGEFNNSSRVLLVPDGG